MRIAMFAVLMWAIWGRANGQSIDYAVLQYPPSATVSAGQTTTSVYGQVYVAGVTDQQSVPGTSISAELGIGAPGTLPYSDPSWRWYVAAPNPGWDFSQNNDEYFADIVTHASGTYDYAFRFSYDSGAWTYADLDGSLNNYSTDQAGQLTVTGSTIFIDDFEFP